MQRTQERGEGGWVGWQLTCHYGYRGLRYNKWTDCSDFSLLITRDSLTVSGVASSSLSPRDNLPSQSFISLSFLPDYGMQNMGFYLLEMYFPPPIDHTFEIYQLFQVDVQFRFKNESPDLRTHYMTMSTHCHVTAHVCVYPLTTVCYSLLIGKAPEYHEHSDDVCLVFCCVSAEGSPHRYPGKSA